jgi:hypothetical protein
MMPLTFIMLVVGIAEGYASTTYSALPKCSAMSMAYCRVFETSGVIPMGTRIFFIWKFFQRYGLLAHYILVNKKITPF